MGCLQWGYYNEVSTRGARGGYRGHYGMLGLGALLLTVTQSQICEQI